MVERPGSSLTSLPGPAACCAARRHFTAVSLFQLALSQIDYRIFLCPATARRSTIPGCHVVWVIRYVGMALLASRKRTKRLVTRNHIVSARGERDKAPACPGSHVRLLATTSSGNDAKHPWRLAGRKEKVKKKKERKKEKKNQNAPSENQPMQLATFAPYLYLNEPNLWSQVGKKSMARERSMCVLLYSVHSCSVLVVVDWIRTPLQSPTAAAAR